MKHGTFTHRVERKRAAVAPVVLPKAAWQGDTYITPEGMEMEVVACGKMPTPEWPVTSSCSLGAFSGRTEFHLKQTNREMT